ncbi:hypothetical protein AVEN_93852-1 [Araneus ventricosus]|uniref:Uncharacterized protein n=1 Tax=Araneus ventricosus TaxID=182803 RepID=A0A4Y2AXM0_ARAVE|nr:hypothetical protein AVEN_93852-1 [Araneus ventricosus]
MAPITLRLGLATSLNIPFGEYSLLRENYRQAELCRTRFILHPNRSYTGSRRAAMKQLAQQESTKGNYRPPKGQKPRTQGRPEGVSNGAREQGPAFLRAPRRRQIFQNELH